MTVDSRFASLLLVIILGFSTSLSANSNCEFAIFKQSTDRLAELDVMFESDCLGGGADTSVVTKMIHEGLGEVTDNASTEDELAVRRNQLLALLISIDGSLTGLMNDMDETWSSFAAITIDQLSIARKEIQNFESTVPAEHWSRGHNYGFFEQSQTGQYLISYETKIDSACPAGSFSENCKSSLRSIVVLTRHIELVRQVLQNSVRQRLALLHGEVKALDSEWTYYFTKARSQFWWEFMANNALYDPPGNVLARPPAGQLILLHPSVAMEYVGSSAFVESSYNVIGIIEVLGYNRLRWKEDGPMSKWPLGISAVATWVPSTPGDDFGYGLMIHIRNNYSFGATRRDTGAGHETTWVFSVDLNKLFLTKSEEAKEAFRSQD